MNKLQFLLFSRSLALFLSLCLTLPIDTVRPEPFDSVRPELSRRTLRTQAGLENETRAKLEHELTTPAQSPGSPLPFAAAGLEAQYVKIGDAADDILTKLQLGQVKAYVRIRERGLVYLPAGSQQGRPQLFELLEAASSDGKRVRMEEYPTDRERLLVVGEHATLSAPFYKLIPHDDILWFINAATIRLERIFREKQAGARVFFLLPTGIREAMTEFSISKWLSQTIEGKNDARILIEQYGTVFVVRAYDETAPAAGLEGNQSRLLVSYDSLPEYARRAQEQLEEYVSDVRMGNQTTFWQGHTEPLRIVHAGQRSFGVVRMQARQRYTMPLQNIGDFVRSAQLPADILPNQAIGLVAFPLKEDGTADTGRSPVGWALFYQRDGKTYLRVKDARRNSDSEDEIGRGRERRLGEVPAFLDFADAAKFPYTPAQARGLAAHVLRYGEGSEFLSHRVRSGRFDVAIPSANLADRPGTSLLVFKEEKKNPRWLLIIPEAENITPGQIGFEEVPFVIVRISPTTQPPFVEIVDSEGGRGQLRLGRDSKRRQGITTSVISLLDAQVFRRFLEQLDKPYKVEILPPNDSYPISLTDLTQVVVKPSVQMVSMRQAAVVDREEGRGNNEIFLVHRENAVWRTPMSQVAPGSLPSEKSLFEALSESPETGLVLSPQWAKRVGDAALLQLRVPFEEPRQVEVLPQGSERPLFSLFGRRIRSHSRFYLNVVIPALSRLPAVPTDAFVQERVLLLTEWSRSLLPYLAEPMWSRVEAHYQIVLWRDPDREPWIIPNVEMPIFLRQLQAGELRTSQGEQVALEDIYGQPIFTRGLIPAAGLEGITFRHEKGKQPFDETQPLDPMGLSQELPSLNPYQVLVLQAFVNRSESSLQIGDPASDYSFSSTLFPYEATAFLMYLYDLQQVQGGFDRGRIQEAALRTFDTYVSSRISERIERYGDMEVNLAIVPPEGPWVTLPIQSRKLKEQLILASWRETFQGLLDQALRLRSAEKPFQPVGLKWIRESFYQSVPPGREIEIPLSSVPEEGLRIRLSYHELRFRWSNPVRRWIYQLFGASHPHDRPWSLVDEEGKVLYRSPGPWSWKPASVTVGPKPVEWTDAPHVLLDETSPAMESSLMLEVKQSGVFGAGVPVLNVSEVSPSLSETPWWTYDIWVERPAAGLEGEWKEFGTFLADMWGRLNGLVDFSGRSPKQTDVKIVWEDSRSKVLDQYAGLFPSERKEIGPLLRRVAEGSFRNFGLPRYPQAVFRREGLSMPIPRGVEGKFEITKIIQITLRPNPRENIIWQGTLQDLRQELPRFIEQWQGREIPSIEVEHPPMPSEDLGGTVVSGHLFRLYPLYENAPRDPQAAAEKVFGAIDLTLELYAVPGSTYVIVEKRMFSGSIRNMIIRLALPDSPAAGLEGNPVEVFYTRGYDRRFLDYLKVHSNKKWDSFPVKEMEAAIVAIHGLNPSISPDGIFRVFLSVGSRDLDQYVLAVALEALRGIALQKLAEKERGALSELDRASLGESELPAAFSRWLSRLDIGAMIELSRNTPAAGLEGVSITDFVGSGKYAAGVPQSQRELAQTLLTNGAVTIAAGVVEDAFRLVTDSDLAAVANTNLEESPIEGVQFIISGELRTEQNFQGQGLVVPWSSQGPFERPGISLRILDPISEQQMRALTPLSWIALDLNRNLTVDQVLNLRLFLLTSHDEQGRTIHAIFA